MSKAFVLVAILVGVLCAWTLAFALLGIYFTALARRARGEGDFLLFALFCYAQGCAELFSAAHLAVHTFSAIRWVVAGRALAGLTSTTLYFVLLVRLSVRGGVVPSWLRNITLISAGTAVLLVVGLVVAPIELSWTALRFTPGSTSMVLVGGPHPTILPAAALSLGLSFGGCFLMLRAVFRGEPVLRAAYIGSIIVTFSELFDIFDWLFNLGLPTLSDHVFFFFAFSVSYALTAQLAEDATRRSDELRQLNETLRTLRVTLQHKEQLAAVGELSAVLAHEVRNPISVICNAVASLRKPELPASDRSLLHTILDEESHRLNRIVTNMLQLARPLAPEARKIDLRVVIEKLVGSLQNTDTEVNTEIHLDVETNVMVDGDLLRQALQNIVDNALQAMRSGGTLTIRLMPNIRKERPGYLFTISDTGEGMNTEVRSRARDAFFTTRASGTGLGLAIVDRIVQAMDGELEIESVRDEGTTVRIWIPRKGDANSADITRPMKVAMG